MIPELIPTEFYDRFLFAMNYAGEMVIQMEMNFGHNLDADRLRRAIELAMDAEPVLGCRLDRSFEHGMWRRLPASERKVLVQVDDGESYERCKHEMIDAEIGPLLSACLWRREGGDRLLIKEAHVVADAAAVKRTAVLLSFLYTRLADEPGYTPTPNLDGERNIEQLTRNIPWTARPRIVANFLKEIGMQTLGRRCQNLSLSAEERDTPAYLCSLIPKERTTRLVDYGHLHNATINDIFLTAFMRGLASVTGWSGETALRMAMTIDLRRYIPDGHCDGLCNLSALEPVSLGRNLEEDFEQTLQRVSGLVGDRKQHWIGLNLYGGLTGLISNKSLADLQKLFVKFWGKLVRDGMLPPGLTNMGAIPDLDFDGPPEEAHLLVPPMFPPMVVFGLSGYGGTLSLTAGVYPGSRPRVEEFMEAILEELP